MSSPSKFKLPGGAVYSLIVFNDDATFPELRYPPDLCWITKPRRVNEVIDEILSGRPVLSDSEVLEVAYRLRQNRVHPDKQVRRAHVQNIQRAIGRDRILE